MNTIKLALTAMTLATNAAVFAISNTPGNEISSDSKYRPDRASMGNGYFQAFVKQKNDGSPKSIGIKFPKQTLENLPTNVMHDGSTCFDVDNNNEIDLHSECTGGHARTLRFNSDLTPFNNITINWESHGHVPPGIYDSPHFDFHFYMTTDIERKKIFPGNCPGLLNCEVLEKAIVPIPEIYIHPDYLNTELAFAHMGNHYVDGTSPELNGGEFTHTFILGSFDGHITFYEPMVSKEYLLTQPNICNPIKQPLAFEVEGYYPTTYCVRYNENSEMYKVSLEDFEYKLSQ